MSFKKPRADSKLLNLPEVQQMQLAEWLLSGMKYSEALKLVHKEFGVSSSVSALHGFWDEVCTQQLLARRARSIAAAQSFSRETQSKDIDQAFAQQLKQMAFELTCIPNPDPDQVFAVIGHALKLRDQDLKESDIKLKKDKFEFDAAKLALKHAAALKQIANTAGIDETERINRARQKLFGSAAPTE